jgi:hypothetical protein
MTIAEELVRDVDRMKAEGKSEAEIMAVVDEVICKWNMETLERIRLAESKAR